MKAFLTILDSIPDIRWFEWHDLEELERAGRHIASVSKYCFVFSPADCKIFIMHFNFNTLKWHSSVYKDARTFEIQEISHWAFVPEFPEGWDLETDEYFRKADEWAITESERKKKAKEVSKKLFQN
jgi:hypothetical protein